MSSKSKSIKSNARAAVLLLIAFLAGSLFASLTFVKTANAEGDHVFELRIYHVVPGKLRVMESRFREKTSKILGRHHLNVVGYCMTEDEKNNSFVFLLAHASWEEAGKNWQGFGSDPEFQEVLQAEQTDKTLEKAEIIWLRPTDFSPIK